MTREQLIEFAMWLDEGTEYFGKTYIETKADEWVGIKSKVNFEPFYCWDEDALGHGSRCKVECDICKNKGRTPDL